MVLSGWHEHLFLNCLLSLSFCLFCDDCPKGMKQALWLTKTKLIEGLPQKVLSLVDDPRNHIENQEERVLDIISHARLWHSTEDIPKRETYW